MTDFESAGHTAHYTYNPDGMRRSKAVDGNPVITHIWNGSEIVAEVGGAIPTIQNTYVYGLERIMTGDGEYFTYNSHGDTTGFDGDEYDYDAFGNQIDSETETAYNPFRYCGEYFDEETGFVYLRARYYDPSTQRFVTEDTHWNLDNMIYGDRTFGEDETPVPDPAAAVQSGNLYAYCMGNPGNMFDYTGNNALDSIFGFFNGIFRYFSGGHTSLKINYNDKNDYQAGTWMGTKFTEFTQKNDFVFDFSISADVGDFSGTVGYSYIDGNASGYTAGYVHIGGGLSVGLCPISGSISIGIVNNAPTADSYSGSFFDVSAAMGVGVDYCYWPNGAEATSITLATNAGYGFRYDYYILVHSKTDGKDYYDLYQKS